MTPDHFEGPTVRNATFGVLSVGKARSDLMKAVVERFGAASPRRNGIECGSSYRGARKGDHILGTFAERFLASFDGAQPRR